METILSFIEQAHALILQYGDSLIFCGMAILNAVLGISALVWVYRKAVGFFSADYSMSEDEWLASIDHSSWSEEAMNAAGYRYEGEGIWRSEDGRYVTGPSDK